MLIMYVNTNDWCIKKGRTKIYVKEEKRNDQEMPEPKELRDDKFMATVRNGMCRA